MKATQQLKIWQLLALILIVSAMTLIFTIAIQPGAFTQSFRDIWTRPLTIFLNGFPVLMTVCLGYFLLGNIFWGGAAGSFLWLLLSYINLLKIEGREDAFVPADIGLFKEAMAAVNEYALDLHPPILALILIYCAGLLILGFLLKSPRPKAVLRTVSAGFVVGAFALSMVFVYPSADIYNSFTVPDKNNVPSIFNTLGFNYCYLHSFNLYPVDKPAGYSASQVEEWQEAYATAPERPADTPNIIVVMGEAFTDLSNEPVFNWTQEEDNPAFLYNRLTQSDQAISGHIIVPNISAGTANTEFDVITGMCTNMIGEKTTSSFRTVYQSVPTVASILRDEGYHTGFMHPGDSWFYNRSNVYRLFGMEQQVYKDAFDMEKDTYYGRVMDDAFGRKLRQLMEENTTPQFLFGVTIQNHQTYIYEKYPDLSPAAPTAATLSPEATENLAVYLRGVKDTAAMLSELADYLDQQETPTLLVFFGDHLPNLGQNFQAYRELGLPIGQKDTPQHTLDSYKTPFLIYANRAYCEGTDIDAIRQRIELPENNTISAVYFGAMVLETAGFSGQESYFNFLNQARRQLPVFRPDEEIYQLPDGSFTEELTDPDLKDILQKLDWWEYYHLK